MLYIWNAVIQDGLLTAPPHCINWQSKLFICKNCSAHCKTINIYTHIPYMYKHWAIKFLVFTWRTRDLFPSSPCSSFDRRSRSIWALRACMLTSSLNLASSDTWSSSSNSSICSRWASTWPSSIRLAFSSSWTYRQSNKPMKYLAIHNKSKCLIKYVTPE